MKDPQHESGRWWRQACADFDFLPVARQAGKYDTCCFLAQQTAEKALKAYLYAQGEELILSHSIFKLCGMASEYAPEFADLRERVKLLDFYYVEARYPNALEEVIPADFYSAADAEHAIAMARDVLMLVERLLAGR